MDIFQIILSFAVSLGAGIVGAVSGAGSGIIVRPVLDFFTEMPTYYTSLLSSLAVFTMALTAFIKQGKNMKNVKIAVALPIAIGSTIGGTLGNLIFSTIRAAADVLILGIVQAVVMITVVGILLIHQVVEDRVTSFHWSGIPTFLMLGTVLGMIAAFLGIGGGPLNLSSLSFFASMNIKVAALYSIFIITFAQGANLTRWAFLTEAGWPDVSFYLIIAVVSGSIIGAFIGAGMYKKVDRRFLKMSYCGVLIFVILITTVNLVIDLLAL